MSPTLLELLRCPETGQRLSMAGEALIARVEGVRREGALQFASSAPGPLQWNLEAPIVAGLLREDGQVLYVVQNGIPVLLPGHGIIVPE